LSVICCGVVSLTQEKARRMFNSVERQHMTNNLQPFPTNLEIAVKGLYQRQWDTSDCEGGWTICQVVHHLADSHLNGFVQMNLVLTLFSKSIVLIAKCKAAHRGILRRSFSPVNCLLRSE
jgi:hypothetical protein